MITEVTIFYTVNMYVLNHPESDILVLNSWLLQTGRGTGTATDIGGGWEV